PPLLPPSPTRRPSDLDRMDDRAVDELVDLVRVQRRAEEKLADREGAEIDRAQPPEHRVRPRERRPATFYDRHTATRPAVAHVASLLYVGEAPAGRWRSPPPRRKFPSPGRSGRIRGADRVRRREGGRIGMRG